MLHGLCRSGTVIAAFIFLSILSSSAPAQDGERLRDPCVANLIGTLGALADDKKHLYTQGTIFERVPKPVAALARAPHPPTVATMIAVPASDGQFKAVFGSAATAADVRQLKAVRDQTAAHGLSLSTAVHNRADFRQFLAQSKEQFIVLSGHNEGGQFVFLAGQKDSLPLLGEECARAQKICIFISCRSKDYLDDGSVGVRRDLTLAEGVWLTHRVRDWIRSQGGNVTLEQVAAQMKRTETEAHLRYHVSYFALGSCAAAGTGAVLYLVAEGIDA